MAKDFKVKRRVWLTYDLWRKDGIYCPALKSRVRVSLLGWRHITGATGHKKRSFGDVYRRLKLLPYAKEILEESTNIQDISIRNSRTFYAFEAMKLIGSVWIKVRVVLIEDAKKNKIFLSVMDRKKKNGAPHASVVKR
jgi:hypothetical protein